MALLMVRQDRLTLVSNICIIGNLPVNWPKLLGPFRNGFTNFFRCVYVQNVILHHFWYKEIRYYIFVF